MNVKECLQQHFQYIIILWMLPIKREVRLIIFCAPNGNQKMLDEHLKVLFKKTVKKSSDIKGPVGVTRNNLGK